MTLATLHTLAGANLRIVADAEYKLCQGLRQLFPQLQAVPAPVPAPGAGATGNRATSAAWPRRLTMIAAAWEGAT